MDTVTRARRIIIVEDNKRIADAIQRKLKTNLELKLQNKKFDIIKVDSIEDFEKIEYDSGDKHIIDLNLGSKREEEGIKIIDLLKRKCVECDPIVYTAYVNFRKKCEEMGIDPDRFIKKGNLTRGIKKIEDILIADYQSDDNPPDTSPSTETDTVANQKQESTIPEDSQLMTKIQNILSNNSGLEVSYLSVLSDIVAEYGSFPSAARIAACKYFLETFRREYEHFGINNKVLEVSVQNSDFDAQSLKRTRYFACQFINRDTRQIERLFWQVGQKVYDLNFSSLKSISSFLSSRETKLKNAPLFIIHLAEHFIAKRLKDLYLRTPNDELDNIHEPASELKYGLGKMSFMSGVWEDITCFETEDARETQLLLTTTTNLDFPDIEKIFYCQIAEIDETERVAHTECFSLEDTHDLFPRSYDLSLFSECGPMHTKACFKIIFYKGEVNDDNPSISNIFVEPIPFSVYYDRKQL